MRALIDRYFFGVIAYTDFHPSVAYAKAPQMCFRTSGEPLNMINVLCFFREFGYFAYGVFLDQRCVEDVGVVVAVYVGGVFLFVCKFNFID